MGSDISRRDFLNGASVIIGTSFLPSSGVTASPGAQDGSGYYPPELSGMRGSHVGSFETAHEAVSGKKWRAHDSGEHYDLIVIGAGISGLSAAYFYQKAMGRNARILVLDNHDDFGGHAKRNEFEIDGRLMIGYGGTMSLEAPAGYPEVAKELIRDLGIDTQRFNSAFDRKLYKSAGLSYGTFFDKETFGSDHLAVGELTDSSILKNIPMSTAAQAELARLLADDRNYLPEMPATERMDFLSNITYEDYLRDYADIGDEVIRYVRSLPRNVWAIGSDAIPATVAWSGGYPGFSDLDLGFEPYEKEDDEPFIFHFPDGNASVARLLVRRMIPEVAAGDSMEDIVTARFDYHELDNPDSAVRIRLNSTVVHAEHADKKLQGDVRVTYVRDGEAQLATGKKVVMAGYHAIAPHIFPELPENKSEALSNSIRAPLVYTNVLIRDWTSFVKLGLQYAYCPGSYHHSATLDYPVSLGSYSCPKSPQEPMILHLSRVPIEPGLSAKEQFVAGQRELLTTSFETFERNVRDQLGRMLGDGGFDPARDIAGITVNRWPHGYAYGYDPVNKNVAFEYSHWQEQDKPWLAARTRFGNIAFAGTDAASEAMTEAAIEEANRAVSDLLR
jgi:spermidine dehydrogenase